MVYIPSKSVKFRVDPTFGLGDQLKDLKIRKVPKAKFEATFVKVKAARPMLSDKEIGKYIELMYAENHSAFSAFDLVSYFKNLNDSRKK